MVTGHVKKMQERDPRKVKLIYGKDLKSPIFENNPRIAGPKDQDVQHYYPRDMGLRPYCAEKSPTLWKWKPYKPEPGEFYFSIPELHFANEKNFRVDVVLEPSVKNKASPNKNWGFERWDRLSQLLWHADLKIVQLGPVGTRTLNHARWVQTENFRFAAALLAKARVAVLPEGGLHHAAAAVGVPSVVIYGGFISPQQTGYDMHTNLFTGGVPCGNRLPCSHCDDAMNKITPEIVFAETMKLLKRRP